MSFASSTSSRSTRSHTPSLTPGERLAHRIEAQRFFLTSAIADWMAKRGVVPPRRTRRPSGQTLPTHA